VSPVNPKSCRTRDHHHYSLVDVDYAKQKVDKRMDDQEDNPKTFVFCTGNESRSNLLHNDHRLLYVGTRQLYNGRCRLISNCVKLALYKLKLSLIHV